MTNCIPCTLLFFVLFEKNKDGGIQGYIWYFRIAPLLPMTEVMCYVVKVLVTLFFSYF